MKLSSISILIVSISLNLLKLSQSFDGSAPQLSSLLVAKCGYICWLRYGIDGPKDLYANANWHKLTSIDLDDYQIGELRGCMEECLISETETEFYPPFDQSF